MLLQVLNMSRLLAKKYHILYNIWHILDEAFQTNPLEMSTLIILQNILMRACTRETFYN